MTKQSTLPRSVVLQRKKKTIARFWEKAEASEQDIIAAGLNTTKN